MAVVKALESAEDLLSLVETLGFVPFMRCGIEGFSLEEHTPASRWFVKDVEGPWEWREALADRLAALYPSADPHLVERLLR